MAKSYYEILEVDTNATEEQIRKAYRNKIRDYHPDLNPDKAKANQRTRDLNVALGVLTDSSMRKRYDEQLTSKEKTEANAEFDFPENAEQSQEEMAEFEFNNAGEYRSKKSNVRHAKLKKSRSALVILSIATAGLSAISVSLLSLWVLGGMDPTGLIAKGGSDGIKEYNRLRGNGEGESISAVQEMRRLSDECDDLKLKLAAKPSQAESELKSETDKFAAEMNALQLKNKELKLENANRSNEIQRLREECDVLKQKLTEENLSSVQSENMALAEHETQNLIEPDISAKTPIEKIEATLASFEMKSSPVLPFAVGTYAFSNRTSAIKLIDGECFEKQKFLVAQVEMLQPSKLEIKVSKPGLIFIGVHVGAEKVPKRWDVTDSVFCDSDGRLFRVYELLAPRKGSASIPWAHKDSGAQVLIPVEH